MLVLRGLSTLLVGYTVSILGAPSWTNPETTIQLARSEAHDWNESGVGPVLEDGNGRQAAPTAVPPRPIRLQDAQRPSWPQRDQARSKLRTREEPLSPVPTIQDINSTEPCPECGVNTSGVSTVFVTSTRTSTVTLFAGSPVTSLLLTTATETLTFLNPTQATQTSTITVTSFFRLARRTNSPVPEQSHVANPSDTLERRQEATITSTITTVITTTITTQSTVFATRTNTIFVTVTVGPNAGTTVFTTTTIFTTSPTPPITTPTTSPTATPTTSPSISSSSPGPSSSSTSTGLPPTTTPTEIPGPSSTSSVPTTMATSTTSAPDTMMSMMSSTTSSGGASSSSGNPFPFPTATPSPTNTAVPPSGLPGSSLSADQIAGIVLGTVAGIFLIVLAILAIRWCIRRRRGRLAAMRQQLSTTTMGVGATAAAVGGRAPSPGGSATSGLTGEGEVRIVIRPARSQLWPMPPGHGGPTYSFFVEDTTTGQTTPAGDPATWSNASESGSVRVIPRKPILSASGPGTHTGSSSGGARTASSGGRSVPRTSGTGAAGPSTMRDAAGNSLISVGWGTSLGGRSSFSNTGVNTNLSPPPAARGNAMNGGNRGNVRSGTGYPGSWGIGRAM